MIVVKREGGVSWREERVRRVPRGGRHGGPVGFEKDGAQALFVQAVLRKHTSSLYSPSWKYTCRRALNWVCQNRRRRVSWRQEGMRRGPGGVPDLEARKRGAQDLPILLNLPSAYRSAPAPWGPGPPRGPWPLAPRRARGWRRWAPGRRAPRAPCGRPWWGGGSWPRGWLLRCQWG